jgi:hypothetical protein
VTVSIFQDGGGNQLGSTVYQDTFTGPALLSTDTGNNTDVVTVDIGAVALAAGNYDVFFSNPNNLGITGYAGGAGGQIAEYVDAASPATGDSYYYLGGNDTGISISGSVPEPATWAMMLIGFGMVGVRLKRRHAARSDGTA